MYENQNETVMSYNIIMSNFQGSSAPIERLSRANKSFLSEGDQKKLQQEGTFCLLTVEALHRHDMLTGATELRQFACLDCNHPWWKHVLRTKPVASCYSCHIRYDALAREKEFGIGRYICHVCEHTFFVWCEATQLQVCYECNTVAGPPFISPRFKSVRSAAVRTGRKQPPPRTILHASTPHVSSGSTNASSVITEDLGSDIFVTLYSVAPQYYLAENFVNTPFYEAFAGGMGGLQLLESPIEVAGPEHFIGEASRLNCLSAQSASQLEGEVSRKRTFAAVASDSNSDGTSQGVQGSGHN